MSGPVERAFCQNCGEAVPLDIWHVCCCGVYRMLTHGDGADSIQSVTVPRSVAVPSWREGEPSGAH